MDQLAIFGWTRNTPALVAALAAEAGLEASAVGDEHPAALARARGALEVPCFHHVHEMARLAAFDVALIGAVEAAADIAEAAARRGADVLLDGASADGETLSRAAAAATRYGVALVVLRPWLRAPGLPALTARLASTPSDLLLIDAVEDRPALALLRDVVGLTVRISGGELLDVAASPAGSPENPLAVAVQLQLSGGRVASLTARRGEEEALRLVASTAGDSLMLSREGGRTTVRASLEESSETIVRSPIEASGPEDRGLVLAEARRVPEARASGVDALLAGAEGVILSAIERALEHGFAAHLEERSRPALRLLRGGGRAASPAGPRRAALSLVPR